MSKFKIIRRPDTPLFVKPYIYWPLIVLLTGVDSITLYSLFDVLMAGNWIYSLISTVGVTVVLDVYSVMLPSAIKYMKRKLQYIIFGIGLAAIILTVYVTYVILRLKTGGALSTDNVYIMDSSSSSVFSFMLALVPLASTFFSFYLSIHKGEWDMKNIIYTLEEVSRAVYSKIHELEKASDRIIQLREVDDEGFFSVVEYIKALCQELKVAARLEFARSIGDSDSVAKLTANNNIISSDILSEMKSRKLFKESDDKRKDDNENENNTISINSPIKFNETGKESVSV